MDVKQVTFPLPDTVTSISEKDFSSRVIRQGESTFIIDRSKVVVLGSLILKLTDQKYNLELWPWGTYTKEQYDKRVIVSEDYYVIEGSLESIANQATQEVYFHYDGSNHYAEHPRIEPRDQGSRLYKLATKGDTYSAVKDYLKRVLNL